MERTLVLLKPDTIHRRLVGAIINRLEAKGLQLVGAKMIQLDERLLDKLYSHLSEKPFFPRIRRFMSSSPILATCWEGLDCVRTVRVLCGATLARDANPGTIRGDFGMSVQNNLVHASESLKHAVDEIKMFFLNGELFDFSKVESMVYSEDESKPRGG